MTPEIIIYYVKGESERNPGEKIAKAAFVNEGDALIFWNALAESRKRYLRMETMKGEVVAEIAHTGFNDSRWGGYYGHANALTESQPLPSRTRDRADAEKHGWEFEKIEGSTD